MAQFTLNIQHRSKFTKHTHGKIKLPSKASCSYASPTVCSWIGSNSVLALETIQLCLRSKYVLKSCKQPVLFRAPSKLAVRQAFPRSPLGHTAWKEVLNQSSCSCNKSLITQASLVRLEGFTKLRANICHVALVVTKLIPTALCYNTYNPVL